MATERHGWREAEAEDQLSTAQQLHHLHQHPKLLHQPEEEEAAQQAHNGGDASAATISASASPARSNQQPSSAGRQRGVYGFTVSRINVTVVGVLLVFAFLFFVDVFLIIVPWLSYSVPGVTNLGVLLLTTGVSLYCYLFCVLLDPGSVPPGWRPDEEQHAVTEVKRKDGGVRFCQKCQRHKPPRTHHCRVCGRCVLRMDHHCPWTNNCIGHANYRAFIVFLIHVTAAALHTVGLICAHVLHAIQVSQEQRIIRTGPKGDPIHLQGGWHSTVWVYVGMQTLAFAISLPLTVGLLMLLAWHMHLLAVNKTTIEYKEGVRSSLHTYEHPYDLGLCGNLHESLGDSPLEWCLPPCGPVTDGGTKFLTVHEQRALGF